MVVQCRRTHADDGTDVGQFAAEAVLHRRRRRRKDRWNISQRKWSSWRDNTARDEAEICRFVRSVVHALYTYTGVLLAARKLVTFHASIPYILRVLITFIFSFTEGDGRLCFRWRRYVGQLPGANSRPMVTKLRQSYPRPQGKWWLKYGRSRSKVQVGGGGMRSTERPSS